MAITKITKHDNSQVKAIQGPFGIHYGKLVTSQKNRHIQWLNQADYEAVKALTTGLKNDPSVIQTNNAK